LESYWQSEVKLLKNPKASEDPVVVIVDPAALEDKVTMEVVESDLPKNPPTTALASLKVIEAWEAELRICTFWDPELDETVAKKPPATLVPTELPQLIVE